MHLRAAAGRRSGRHQSGAALLVAMLIAALVSALASAMVWQQARAVDTEAADRAGAQAGWMLGGLLDWACAVLREDQRQAGADTLQEDWAQPRDSIGLDDWLAVDEAQVDSARNGTARVDAATSDAARVDTASAGMPVPMPMTTPTPTPMPMPATEPGADTPHQTHRDAEIAGPPRLSLRIVDAQARYNLGNLRVEGVAVAEELDAFVRLCDAAGVSAETARRIAAALVASNASAVDRQANAPIAIEDERQLHWLSVDPAVAQRLRPHVVLIPSRGDSLVRTTVNLNTASREVLAAVIGVHASDAERLVVARRSRPFDTLEAARAWLPHAQLKPSQVGTTSDHFEVQARYRLEAQVVEERSLLRRQGLDVTVLRRHREAACLEGCSVAP